MKTLSLSVLWIPNAIWEIEQPVLVLTANVRDIFGRGNYMASVIEIDKLQITEKEAVIQLLLESYEQYANDFSPEGWQEYVRSIKASLENPNIDQVLVAKSGEKILGSLQLFENAVAAYQNTSIEITNPIIRLLAVSPEARGKGIAQALLKESVRYAKAKGADYLYLHSSDTMKNAVRLYEWFGFKRDESKDFHAENVHVKCFRLEL